MNIQVKLGGCLREVVRGQREGLLSVSLPPGARIRDLIGRLGLEATDVKLIFRNHRPARQDDALEGGDRIGLFPPQLAYNTYVAVYFTRDPASHEDTA